MAYVFTFYMAIERFLCGLSVKTNIHVILQVLHGHCVATLSINPRAYDHFLG